MAYQKNRVVRVIHMIYEDIAGFTGGALIEAVQQAYREVKAAEYTLGVCPGSKGLHFLASTEQ